VCAAVVIVDVNLSTSLLITLNLEDTGSRAAFGLVLEAFGHEFIRGSGNSGPCRVSVCYTDRCPRRDCGQLAGTSLPGRHGGVEYN